MTAEQYTRWGAHTAPYPIDLCEVCAEPATITVYDFEENTTPTSVVVNWVVRGKHGRCLSHPRESLYFRLDGRILSSRDYAIRVEGEAWSH